MSAPVHDHAAAGAAVSAEDRARLGRRAQLLAGASVSYNLIEGVIAVTAGLVAGSVALIGFGLDSAVEVSSGLIILWQFRHCMPESREQQALRLIAVSFFALAAYVTFESVRALVTQAQPEAAPVGIALAVASLIVMPYVARAQRRTGQALHSYSVVADSNQTLLCTCMSVVLRRPRLERRRRLVVGRPARRTRHRRHRAQGEPRGLARRRLLCSGLPGRGGGAR